MTGRNALNESMTMTNPAVPQNHGYPAVYNNNRAHNHSGGSGVGGYADTGYGESVNRGSNADSEIPFGSSHGQAAWSPPTNAQGSAYGAAGYGNNNGPNPYGNNNGPNPYGNNNGPNPYNSGNASPGPGVIKFGNSGDSPAPVASKPTVEEPKRKSWFGRKKSSKK